MKEITLNKTVHFLSKYQKYSDEELEKLRYGLEGIYLTVTKLIIIVVLSIVFKIFFEVISILLLFNVIRYFGFGIHARKSSECLISSIVCFIIIPLLLLNIQLSKIAIGIVGIVSIINLLIFAPADTIKRPLPNKKKRIIRKVITTIIGILYLFISLASNNEFVSLIFFSSIIIEVIMINPITYMIMRQPYNNYKKL